MGKPVVIGEPMRLPGRGASVTLHPSTWDQLDLLADFETDVYRAAGQLNKESSITRNAVIRKILTDALPAYWAKYGGLPTSKPLWKERVKQACARLEREGAIIRRLRK